ncbi:glycosyltransferase family 2 protein [Spirulina sp. CCNP1310]|uniref:glycosyltransferase family 2 protein n=1 Tax=Spirulina sp. CCNP1310 TaxID=3110249 RepID=UPI002B20627E|nr:glycosyltransferase family 2 protein [Spirulina sp. CCNP1310]MEA5417850.1 glycosyltransferase family 2 protein [Spirulina sp. CCNP1310]
MVLLVSVLMLIPTGILCLLCAVLWLECWGATIARAQPLSRTLGMPKTVVLIPAHNEAEGIAATLKPILLELPEAAEILVIADNCTDDTAAVVRSLGIQVLEREDPEHRGKGYALDFGLQHLAPDPPAVVVMVDADCDVQMGTIEQIAKQAVGLKRPVQALYLMAKPPQPQAKDAVSAFAFKVKNLVRPLGLWQLQQPCLLTGTGMAFPWEVLPQISLASGNIVEDMQLGLDLAIAGYPPQFSPTTLVMGRLPSQSKAATSQRTRWEHGHLQTLFKTVPRLIGAGMKQGRLDLIALALELAVPPLTLLVLLWGAVMGLSLGLWGLGWSLAWPVFTGAIAGLLLFTAIFTAWLRFGRQDLSPRMLLSIPFYILWKIPLYFRFLTRPESQWVRTERDRTDG